MAKPSKIEYSYQIIETRTMTILSDNSNQSQDVILQNIRSLPKNFDELAIFTSSILKAPLVYCITETWLNPNHDQGIFTLDGYKALEVASRKKRGGGVGIYVKNSVDHEKISEITCNAIQAVTVKLRTKTNVFVSCVYIPPSSVNESTFHKLEDYIDNLFLGPTDKHILCGDFNVNFLSNNKKCYRLSNLLAANGLTLRNGNNATRESSAKGSKTLIDCFFTNFAFKTNVLKTSISDHYTLAGCFQCNEQLTVSNENILSRNWSLLDKPNVLDKIRRDLNFKGTTFLNTQNDLSVNKAFEDLHEILTETLKTHIPLKQRKHRDKVWIDNTIKNAAAKKHRYKIISIKSPTFENKKKYQEQNNLVKSLIRSKMRSFYSNQLERESDKCNKNFFKVYNDITGKDKRNAEIGQIDVETFNDFFAEIGEKLNLKFPDNHKLTEKRHLNSMVLLHTTKDEIQDIIKQLKNKYSLDIFNLNTIFIKRISLELSKILEKLFNRCLQEGIFPDCLKIAKIIPIYKEGPKNDPSNFRPIALLPIIGKILEKILHKRLSSFLRKENILNDNQFGFREKRSSIDAVCKLVEEIRENIHVQHKKTQCTFIDLKKAFDTVDHLILLNKCYNYGIRGQIYNLLKSYLNNRLHFTSVGNKKSTKKKVKYGVPQGSILGPLLFIIYINDLKENEQSSDLILFADDTAVKTNLEKNESIEKHQKELNSTMNWLRNNKLTLNTKKTKTMCLSKSKKNKSNLLQMQYQKIDEVKSFRYLGIHIDDKLTFDEHIKVVEMKLNKFTSIFYRLRKILNRKTLIRAFKTYIQPIIQYGVLVYGSTAKSKIDKISTKINRILKIIYFRRKYDSIAKEREINFIYNAAELHVYELLKLCIRLIRDQNNIKVIQDIYVKMVAKTNKKVRKCKNILNFDKRLHEKHSIGLRLGVMLTMIVNLYPNILSEAKSFSHHQTNRFCHFFLDSYILGNQEIVNLIFEY